jgi:hypothetical protein
MWCAKQGVSDNVTQAHRQSTRWYLIELKVTAYRSGIVVKRLSKVTGVTSLVRSEVKGRIAEVKIFGLGFHLCNLTSALA